MNNETIVNLFRIAYEEAEGCSAPIISVDDEYIVLKFGPLDLQLHIQKDLPKMIASYEQQLTWMHKDSNIMIIDHLFSHQIQDVMQ